MHSGKKARRRFRTPETVHSAPKHEFWNFFMPNVLKRCQTSLWVLQRLLGAFGRKSSSEVPDPRTSAFGPATGVLQLFRAERTETLQNTPKHRFGSNGGYWVRSSEKSRRRFRTPETVHSAPKHEFCNFFVQNVLKRSKTLETSFWV